MKKLILPFMTLSLSVNAAVSSYPGCPAEAVVQPGTSNLVEVTSTTALKTAPAAYYGFNVETAWISDSPMWDSVNRAINPAVTSALAANFPGAVYRFAGGTISNYFDWTWTVGSIPRAAHPIMNGAMRNWDFGFDEYLSFLKQVNGSGWAVTNMKGTYETGELDEYTLADNMAAWVGYAKNAKQAGAKPITMWELGNELGWGSDNWTPDYYLAKAIPQVNAGRAADGTAKFAGIVYGYRQSTFSNGVMTGLKPYVVYNFTEHQYADDTSSPSLGSPVSGFIKRTCSEINYAKANGIAPNIYLTEYGAVPGTWSVFVKSQASDLHAALTVVDFFAAYAQVPEVKGMFAHSITASPDMWNYFNKWTDGSLIPSITYQALKAVRMSGLSEVLPTRTTSVNTSGYSGGYDLRAGTLAAHDHKTIKVFMAHRGQAAATATIRIPEFAGKTATYTKSVVTAPSVWESNIPAYNQSGSPVGIKWSSGKVTFDVTGSATLPIDAISAISFVFTIP